MEKLNIKFRTNSLKTLVQFFLVLNTSLWNLTLCAARKGIAWFFIRILTNIINVNVSLFVTFSRPNYWTESSRKWRRSFYLQGMRGARTVFGNLYYIFTTFLHYLFTLMFFSNKPLDPLAAYTIYKQKIMYKYSVPKMISRTLHTTRQPIKRN